MCAPLRLLVGPTDALTMMTHVRGAPSLPWLALHPQYEHPEAAVFEGLAMRFMDIRKRIYSYPKLGTRALLVCIPTTSGTGIYTRTAGRKRAQLTPRQPQLHRTS